LPSEKGLDYATGPRSECAEDTLTMGRNCRPEHGQTVHLLL